MKKFLTTTSIALLMTVPAFAGNSNLEEVGTNLEQASDAAGDAIKQTAQDAKTAAENTTKDVDQALENTAQDIGEAAAATGNAIDDTTSDIAAELSAPAMALEGYTPVLQGGMTAEELTGVRVYDASGEWIGEIDNIITTAEGNVDGAVIGVGGFLGIGEKDVLVDFSSLSLMQEIDGESLRAFVDVDEATLEKMPSYDAS